MSTLGYDVRVLVLAAVVVVIPAYLVLRRQDEMLLRWICFTVALDVLNPQFVIHLPAARVAGLIALPGVLRTLKGGCRSFPAKLLLIQYGYAALLGLIFGYLVPWDDGAYLRTFFETGEGRVIVYMLKETGDVSLALFVAQRLVSGRSPDRLIRYVLWGTGTACIGGLLQAATRVDLYAGITGSPPLDVTLRARGFDYEPRGLGLMAVCGLILTLLVLARSFNLKYSLIATLHLAALFVSTSTSALYALAAGLAAIMMLEPRLRRPAFLYAGVTCGLLLCLVILTIQPTWMRGWSDNLAIRTSTNRFAGAPSDFNDQILYRLDIFDGSALQFFEANPVYVLIGTGPGLISLPATAYIPNSIYYAWVQESGAGLNTLPSLGLLIELANGGGADLLLWLLIVGSSLRAARRLQLKAENRTTSDLSLEGSAFAAMACIYLAQASPLSAIWPVFLGAGLAAAQLDHDMTSLTRRSSLVMATPNLQRLPTRRPHLAPVSRSILNMTTEVESAST